MHGNRGSGEDTAKGLADMLRSCVSTRLTECVTDLYLDRLLSVLIHPLVLAKRLMAFLDLGIYLGLQAKSVSVDVYRQQKTSPHIPISPQALASLPLTSPSKTSCASK
jgi:hypothetical protein